MDPDGEMGEATKVNRQLVVVNLLKQREGGEEGKGWWRTEERVVVVFASMQKKWFEGCWLWCAKSDPQKVDLVVRMAAMEERET